jgi:hypothetical protein
MRIRVQVVIEGDGDVPSALHEVAHCCSDPALGGPSRVSGSVVVRNALELDPSILVVERLQHHPRGPMSLLFSGLGQRSPFDPNVGIWRQIMGGGFALRVWDGSDDNPALGLVVSKGSHDEPVPHVRSTLSAQKPRSHPLAPQLLDVVLCPPGFRFKLGGFGSTLDSLGSGSFFGQAALAKGRCRLIASLCPGPALLLQVPNGIRGGEAKA